LAAFPETVAVRRVPLVEAAAKTARFLGVADTA
jgi:hypothetical protein